MFHVNTPVFSAFFLWLFHLLKQNSFVYIFNYSFSYFSVQPEKKYYLQYFIYIFIYLLGSELQIIIFPIYTF